MSPSERGEEIVEESEAAIEPAFVIRAVQEHAEDDLLDSGSIRPPELAVFEVDVMDDFRDVSEPWVRVPNDPNERLERTGIPLVRKVSADHVEPRSEERRV